MAGLPSIAQMSNRSNDGHRKALQALRDGRPCVCPDASPSEVYGMRTVLRTLRRWDAIDDAGGLTERGRALLAVFEGRA